MKIGKRPVDVVYAEFIKPIRNQMRKFDYQSLLNVMLVYLNAPILQDRTKELERLPWVVERLLIWLFADDPTQYRTQVAGQTDLVKLINLAWNSSDKVIAIERLDLFFRQTMLPQAPYQTGLDIHAYLIQIYLLHELPKNSK